MAKPFGSRFANPSTLKSIEPPLLVRLLSPYQAWLAQSGVGLSAPQSIDYDTLSLLLIAGKEIPARLIDLVCAIEELSRPRYYDKVLQHGQRAGLELTGRIPPCNLVARVMLEDPAGVRELLSELRSLRPRRTDRYAAHSKAIPKPKGRIKLHVRSMERDLCRDFEKRQRGRAARIHYFDEPYGFRLMIRRGDTLRSEATIDDDAETHSLVFRPELFDVVRYDQRHGDLLINAKSKADTRSYCYIIGHHIFGDRFLFDPNFAPPRYTLEPIRQRRRDCITYAHLDDIDDARLVLLRLEDDSSEHAKLTLDSPDVFQAMPLIGGVIERDTQLTRAALKVRINGENRDRTVVIIPPITASYDRDDRSEAIETLIEEAGFLLPRTKSLREIPETLFTMS